MHHVLSRLLQQLLRTFVFYSLESKISRRILKLEIQKAHHYEQVHKQEPHVVFEYNIGTFIKNIK